MWCINRQWERGCLCCATGTMFRSIVTISPFRSYPDCFASVSCLLKLQVFLQYKPFGKLQLAVGRIVWDSLLADPHKYTYIYINIIKYHQLLHDGFLGPRVVSHQPWRCEDSSACNHTSMVWADPRRHEHHKLTIFDKEILLLQSKRTFFEVLSFCEIDFELFWDMLLPRLYRVSKPLKPTQARPPRERKSLCVRVAWAIISVIGDPIQGMSRYEYPQCPPKRLSLHSHTWRWPQIYEQYPPKQTFKLFAFFLQSRIEDNSRVLSVLCLRFYGHVILPPPLFWSCPPA